MDLRVVAAITAWVALSAGGLTALVRYKGVPGAEGAVAARWPVESAIALAEDVPTLVLSVHPRCVCSRATLTELARLLSSVDAKVDVHVLFVRPDGVGDDWVKTDLWDRARELGARVDVREDPGGLEAERFGAETSGWAVVYAPSGERLFRGGITSARGHEGDNAGLQRAVSGIRNGADAGRSSVYGCALDAPIKGENG